MTKQSKKVKEVAIELKHKFELTKARSLLSGEVEKFVIRLNYKIKPEKVQVIDASGNLYILKSGGLNP